MIVAVEVTEKPHMRVGVHRTVEIEVMKADVWFRQSNVWGPTFPARRAFKERGERRQSGRVAPTLDSLRVDYNRLQVVLRQCSSRWPAPTMCT